MHANQPIGVFDSGVGGLTVLREIRRELPHEDLLYVADSAHAPYGDQSMAAIEARAFAVTQFLLDQGAKAIVVACNTATGAAARLLRERHPIPIIAMEPALKPAVSVTRSGVIGVLATRQTLASHNFQVLRERIGGGAELVLQACPGLVEQIEAGDREGPEVRTLIARFLAPALTRGADTLVLGCTHYPLLRAQIQALAGPAVQILDSGEGVARQTRRRLEAAGLLSPRTHPGQARFWTSGEPQRYQPLLEQIWQAPLFLEAMHAPIAPPERPAMAIGLAVEGC